MRHHCRQTHSPLELFLWDPQDEPQDCIPESAERVYWGWRWRLRLSWQRPQPPAQPSKLRTVGPVAWLSFPLRRTQGFPPALARALQPASPQGGLERFPALGPRRSWLTFCP